MVTHSWRRLHLAVFLPPHTELAFELFKKEPIGGILSHDVGSELLLGCSVVLQR